MPPKNGKGKKKKAKTPHTPKGDQGPDLVEIARKARLQEKYKRLRYLLQNTDRLVHMTYDKEQFNGFCATYINHVNDEVNNELKTYHTRQVELFNDVRDRFVKDATNYLAYLTEKKDHLTARYNATSSQLNSKYGKLLERKETLEEKAFGLRYLKAVKEDQSQKIQDMRKELADSLTKQRVDAQALRSRHARYRLADLEGREHRLKAVSEHLAKETETHFIKRLEEKRIGNRQLCGSILNRVNEISTLTDLREQLEAKERSVRFKYQYLLKYQRATSLLLKKTPTLTTFHMHHMRNRQLAERDETWYKMWDWNHVHIRPEIWEKAQQVVHKVTGQLLAITDGTAAPVVKNIENALVRRIYSLKTPRSERSFNPPTLQGIVTQKDIMARLQRQGFQNLVGSKTVI